MYVLFVCINMYADKLNAHQIILKIKEQREWSQDELTACQSVICDENKTDS